MKRNLIILLFLISFVAVGQTNTFDKPPKKTWKILIKNSNSKEVNYQLIGQTIIDNDFSIEKKDADYLTMETSPKLTEGQTSSYYLKYIAKDNLIIVTGMAKSRINVQFANVDEEYSIIKNVGMRGSIAKDQFNSMLNFVKLFQNSEFEFITE